MSEKPTPNNDESRNLIIKAAHRFEYYVILLLISSLGILTLVALARLYFELYDVIFISWDSRNYHSVQVLFGMVMTVLIALEFNNSILRHIKERSTIIQAREVILIGMMAVVRKIMIIDLSVASPLLLASLGAATVALASAYWFMRET